MELRNKQHRWLLHLLGAAILLLSLIACDSSEGSTDDDPDKPKPETPIADGDWQVVPATGGTIEKGDITITFPSGTFSKDTKVAVTEVKKGVILGEDEASTFYQVTMPATFGADLTVKVKCDASDKDIYLITYVPSHSLHHPDEETYAPLSYTVTKQGSHHVAVLPASENKDVDDKVSFSIGLAHRVLFSNGSQVGTRVIDGETEGDITWYYDVDRVFIADNAERLTNMIADLNGYIHASIKQITALGFTIRGTRTIPIIFSKKMGGEEWGLFKQHWSNDKKSWLELNEKMITNPTVGKDDVKQTIIHELLHYFQADYDQRVPFIKYRNCKEDELLMYEAGGQWIEKFMNGNKIPYKQNLSNRLKHFMKGIADIEEIYQSVDVAQGDNGKFHIGYARRSHGYSMSALFEYWAKDIGDTKIVDIYHHWNSDASGVGFKNKSTFETLKEFASAKRLSTFEGGYDAFIWACADEEVIENFYIKEFDDEMKRITPKAMSVTFDGRCYAYGVDTKQIYVYWDSAEALTGRKLVIKPGTDLVKTYIYKQQLKADKYQLFNEMPLEIGDSIVITGDELEKFRGSDGIVRVSYYLLNTSYDSGPSKGRKYQLKCELVKEEVSVVPTELRFPAEGGTQNVKVNYGTFTHYGATVSQEGYGWLGVKTAAGVSIDVTAQPNTTGKERECIVNCYVARKANPTDTEKVILPVKVTQTANEKQDDDTQSGYQIMGGSVSMYYATDWKWEVSFKSTDNNVTITPKGKGANVVIQQAGKDFNADWNSEISFDIDDLSLFESGKAKLSNYRYEMVRDGWDTNIGWSHSDWSKTTTKLTSNAPKAQEASLLWYFKPEDLSYDYNQTIHYDKWKKDAYAEPIEKTEVNPKTEVTSGSFVSVGLDIKKK